MLLVWVTVKKCPLISDLWASDTTCALADLISIMCDLHGTEGNQAYVQPP